MISNVTSLEVNAVVGLPGGITSSQASSLHSNSAVNTLVLLNSHVNSSENVAVKSTSPPSAEKTTSINVCGEVKPTTETEAVPSPERIRLPVVGAPIKVIVISAVNVSSDKSVGVPLSLQESMFDDVIETILQAGSTTIVTSAVSHIVLSDSKHIVYSTV